MAEIIITEEKRNEYYEYLDALRESGVTNMFGATPYLKKEFKLKEDVARKILTDWMGSFSARHPIG